MERLPLFSHICPFSTVFLGTSMTLARGPFSHSDILVMKSTSVMISQVFKYFKSQHCILDADLSTLSSPEDGHDSWTNKADIFCKRPTDQASDFGGTLSLIRSARQEWGSDRGWPDPKYRYLELDLFMNLNYFRKWNQILPLLQRPVSPSRRSRPIPNKRPLQALHKFGTVSYIRGGRGN